MAENTIIFQLKRDVTIDKMSGVFTEFSLSPRPLYDIGDQIDKVRDKAASLDLDLSESLADQIFRELIYPFLSDIEKELYRTYVVDVETERVQDVIDAIDRTNNVDYSQRSLKYGISYSPIESSKVGNWGLGIINCQEAWKESKGDNITVAVIDSGVYYSHRFLQGQMWTDDNGYYGKDWMKDTPTPNDPVDKYGHGTHCAGIIATANDTVGDTVVEIGVAPMSKIMAVKIFDQPEGGGIATTDTLCCANAIKYAVDNKAKILSNSWVAVDPTSHDNALQKIIDHAYSQGCILVFAAGNDGHDIDTQFPANYEKVISVAATTRRDDLLGESNYGIKVTMAAPGDDILSLKVNTYEELWENSGTSMACPHVAGLIALIFKINPNFTFCQIKDIICDTGDNLPLVRQPLGERKRINAAASIKKAVEMSKSMNRGRGLKTAPY